MARTPSSIPSTRWRNGLRIRPSAWSGARHPMPAAVLRTLNQLGDVSPDQFPPPWSFHLGIPDTLGAPEVRILANGFELYYPDMAEPACIQCLMTPDGGWAGEASIELHPSLFSPQLPISRHGDAAVVDNGGRVTALIVTRDGGRTRFSVCLDAPDAPSAAEAARAGLSTPVPECWERESALRSRFWEDLRGLDCDTEALRTALETLVYHLEPTAGGGLCSAGGLPADASSPLNALPPLIQCWCGIDTEVAGRLMEDALQRIPTDGLVSAARTASGKPVNLAPWPMLLQACAQFEALIPGTGIVTRHLPALGAYLLATIERMDPGHAGTPSWPSAAESFIPDTYDDNVVSASLTTMLIGEFEAFDTVSADHPVPGMDDPRLDLERERLLAALSTSLWNEADGLCHDRYRDGEPISRATLSGILPVGLARIPGRIRDALVSRAADPAYFAGDEGLRLWQYWETDDAPPPVPAAHQLFLLSALERTAAPVADLEDHCTRAITRWFDAHGALPVDLQSGAVEAQDPENPFWFESPLMAACLALRTLPSTAHRKVESSSPSFLVALDRHRYALLTGLIALLVGGVAFSLLTERRRPTVASEDAVTIQLVASSMARGEYAEARQQLQNLKRSAEPPPTLPFVEANLFFRENRFAEARELYDQCIRDGISAPKAALNRALSFYREGRLDEALVNYQAAIDQFGEEDPSLKRLAETAIRILRVYGPEWLADAAAAGKLE